MKQAAFFLGANSDNGFVSFFESAMAETPDRESWLLKGGPGCGKSTLMSRLGAALEAEEYIYCSSDPDSLDGVLLPGDKLVLDATAPHVLDTPFPGAAGGYILPPTPLDRAGLAAKLPQLRGLKARAAVCYQGAYRLLGAAGMLERQLRAAVAPALPTERLARRAAGICERELPRKMGRGLLKKRFLDGYTPEGWRHLDGTVETLAERVYDLRDDWGLGESMLRQLRDTALERGYTVCACHSPLEPERLRHLLIPEAGLAFVTSDSRSSFSGTPWRRLRLESYLGAPRFKGLRREVKELRRQISELEQGATEYLRMAKELHDRMEQLYRPHLDIPALEQLAASLPNMLE